MKAPLRVAAKEAEKLRKWLASELEPHEIYNIDQYAHHVVTIFLNEDLDIDDEPLSPVGDFLNDIYSLRSGKSVEKKKRAAVQFLKSVISCDKPVETEIERIIDELIVRIEATKDKTSSRKLLGPITLNVASSGLKQSARRNRIEQERRYNEAFPSLSGEVDRNNPAVSLVSNKGAGSEVCQKSPNLNKENSSRNGKQSKLPLAAACSITFSDVNEAEAFMTARLVFSLAIPDGNLPSPDTMEIESSSLTDMLSSSEIQNAFDNTCWKSAFHSVVPTKLFSPNTNSLPFHQNASNFAPKLRPLVIIRSELSSADHAGNFRTLMYHVDLYDPNSRKVFLPLEKVSSNRIPPEMLFARDVNDLEVTNIISWAQINHEQLMKRRRSRKGENEKGRKYHENKKEEHRNRKVENGDVDVSSIKVRVVQSFPDLPNTQWNSGGDNGMMALYPKFPTDQPMARRKNHERHNASSSPTRGVIGGLRTGYVASNVEEKGEVRTNDVLSFALRQLAKFELDRDKTECDIEVNPSFVEDSMQFEHDPSKMEEDVEVCSDAQEIATKSELRHAKIEEDVEIDSNGKSFSPNTCGSRAKLTSIDSGMYPGGDEDTRVSPTEVKASSSSPKAMSPHGNDRKTPCFPAQSNCGQLSASTQVAWRKTPGPGRASSRNGLKNCTESTLPCGGRESSGVRSNCATVATDDCADIADAWDEWADPLPGASWDSMIRQDIFRRVSPTPEIDHEYGNIFQPPELSSSVNSNVSQILQSAFVNTMFAEGPSEPMCQITDSSRALNCADLEHSWLLNQSEETTPTVMCPEDVVRGRTCSNWLENNCYLGIACPFSHPSV